ncbi:hypothetical protein N7467_007175 [Penicillium canescens]|nr:hypothetical protein N7467_007175 [Penicillium canescens]
MEPAGLALGILGLAGLFNTCLDVLNKFDSWSDYGSESRSLTARFKAHKLQLEKWGRAIGFENGILSDEHDQYLDDPRTLSTVKELLSAIQDICGYDDDISPISTPMFTNKAHPRTPLESKRQKLSWALRDKAKRITQVEQFSSIVEILHSLIPINGESGMIFRHGEFARGGGSAMHLNESEIEGHTKVLWVNGPAGFGKSILCTRVIDHLSTMLEAPIAHFFFSTDFERGDPFVVLRSWVAQVMSHPIGFALIRENWATQKGQKATRGEVIKLLREIVIAIPGCTFIVDGLDECIWLKDNQKLSDSDSISGFMEALGRATADTATRIMIVSRDEPEIRTCLPRDTHNVSVFEHKITPEDVWTDVVSYSRSVVHLNLPKKTDTAKERLSHKLPDRQKELEQVITSTPIGMEHIYERNWMRIAKLPEEDRNRAISLLRWTAFSLRPLTVNEMTEALLISECSDEVRMDGMPENIDMDYIEKGILLYCGSLLEIRIPQAECDAGLQTRFRGGKGSGPWVLLNYAAGSWQQHASVGDPKDAGVVELVNRLFDPRRPSWASWREWFDFNDKEGEAEQSRNKGSPASPVFYAARLGLTDTVRFLVHDRGLSPDEKGVMGQTALVATCRKGHLRIAELLLQVGADLTIADYGGCTPLYFASSNGHLEMVRLLLDNGADIKVADNDGWTPLHSASAYGYLEVVRRLLDNGADISVANNEGWTPVGMASAYGHLEVVRLLLDNRADIKVIDNARCTPLHFASINGHLEVVRLLLDTGADITVADEDGWTPLHCASLNGHLEVVRLLFHNGADISVTNNEGWTSLYSTSSEGHLKVLRFLLEGGADITATDNQGWTPLHCSSSNGHLEVVRVLLETGADITATDNDRRTPLHCASSKGHLGVLRLLLKSGADITIADERGCTPLHEASANGHVEVVKLFFQSLEVSVDIRDDTGRTPLFLAAARGRSEILRFLLSCNVLANVKDRYNATPLCAAIRNGHREAVELLLPLAETTADFEDGLGRNLAWWATKSGCVKIIELVRQWAQRMGIEICERDLNAACSLFPFERGSRWCDFAMNLMYAWSVMGAVFIVLMLPTTGFSVILTARPDCRT